MKLLKQHGRQLRLETLESRTLLAGVGFEAALAEISPAVKGSGDFTLGFNPRIGQNELFITGANTGSVTVDFNLLPAFVTAVTVKSFDTVTFTGNDILTKLVASDIKTLDADGIKLDFGLYADNVGTVSLASGGSIAVLSGNAAKLEIANLDSTLIISDLQTLSVVSKSPVLAIVSLNSTQTVKVLYQADTVSVSGLSNSAQQVLFLPDGEPTPGGQPGPGNVVTITPNEETSYLIARLREAIRAGGVGNPLAVFELLGRPEWHVAQAPTSMLAHVPFELSKASMPAAFPSQQASPEIAAEFAPTLGEIELQGLMRNPQVTEPVLIDIAREWAPHGAAPSGAILPHGVLGGLTADEAESILAAPLFHSDAESRFFEELIEDSRTLKDFVLQGVVAEIMPGEQTAFLLVDPKPSRANTDRNRESSLELVG